MKEITVENIALMFMVLWNTCDCFFISNVINFIQSMVCVSLGHSSGLSVSLAALDEK